MRLPIVLISFSVFIMQFCVAQDANKEKAIQTLLDYSEMDKALRTDIEGRLPLHLLTNDLIDPEMELQYKGMNIIMVDTPKKEDDNLIEVVDFKSQGDTVKIAIFHEFQNMEIKGVLLKKERAYKVERFETIEF